jgi:hypothetical protein
VHHLLLVHTIKRRHSSDQMLASLRRPRKDGVRRTITIESEWTRNVVAKQGADAETIQACLEGMRDAVPGWEVTGYSKHVDKFEAVDAKDRHVAAAAYKLSLDDWPGQAVALVTKNVKDFPAKAFGETEVTRFSLGAYVDALHAAEPERVARVAEICRKKCWR